MVAPFRKRDMQKSQLIQGVMANKSLGELVRFGVVGVVHNLLGYLVYLLITWLGVDPKLAVVILYPLGMVASYYLNRRWTFDHTGAVAQSMTRYVSMHVCGLLANILILYIGHDLMEFPHQLVQLFTMFFLAGVSFLVSKFLIFSSSDQ